MRTGVSTSIHRAIIFRCGCRKSFDTGGKFINEIRAVANLGFYAGKLRAVCRTMQPMYGGKIILGTTNGNSITRFRVIGVGFILMLTLILPATMAMHHSLCSKIHSERQNY